MKASQRQRLDVIRILTISAASLIQEALDEANGDKTLQNVRGDLELAETDLVRALQMLRQELGRET